MKIKVKTGKNPVFDDGKPTHAEQRAQIKAGRSIDHLSTKRVIWLLVKRHKFFLVCLVGAFWFLQWLVTKI